MIRNIVFDMAWVLFEYKPKQFTEKYLPKHEDAELVYRELFCAPEWLETDRGRLSDEEYLSIVLGRLPGRLHAAARFLYEHWHEMPVPITGMEEIVRRLKQGGYGIYLLSNMSSRFYRFYKRIPAMHFFDGMIVSADVHAIKPEPDIYLILFRRFGLKPEECFFIDDRAENVAAADALGMKGFCFTQNIGELEAGLRAGGITL